MVGVKRKRSFLHRVPSVHLEEDASIANIEIHARLGAAQITCPARPRERPEASAAGTSISEVRALQLDNLSREQLCLSRLSTCA